MALLMSGAQQFIAGWFCFGLAGLITLAMLLLLRQELSLKWLYYRTH